MHRILLQFIFLTVTLLAKESLQDENIQILAEKLEVKNDIVNASGKVVVYSPNYYITANRLIYDQVNAKLELFDNVNIIRNNEVVSYSQYIFIDIKKDINNFKPMLILENSNKLWFNAKSGLKENNKFDLKSSTLSSCDCQDPAWSISFTSGDFNTTKQWMNTYNTTLYIKNVPVFYTPYFGFPTDDTRRTGLLTPTVGYSKNEGFIYAQPIYFAPKLNYDFEYIPQIRSNRGYGHALKYRYVDSMYSSLNFETGMFKEKDSYREKTDLSNSKHYGWDLEYKRSKLFSTNDHSDGLIIDLVDMNDVDYINTKYNSNSTDDTDKFLESRVKYFYNTNKYYGDIEANLYNDISKDNNDDVLQKIPTVNLHKYSNSIFDNLFTTSVDISSNRKTRKTGVGANTTELFIPINYHSYLFNDYLNFSFSEQINYTNIKYKNANYQDANYAENNHVLSLYTDLVKPYTSFVHSLGFNVTYTNSNQFEESGDIYDADNSATSELSPFAIAQTTNNITLGLNQSIYNKMTLKEIVNHKLSQSYVYNSITNSYEKNTLQNDLRFNYDYGSLTNRLIYSYIIKDITSSSTSFKFEMNQYFTNMYYTYFKNIDSLEEEKTFTYDLGFSFAKHYKSSYKEEYDLLNHISKKREYIFNIDDKCWAVDFKLIDSLVASDTTTNVDSYRQKILYVEFNLKQLFQVNQKYELRQRD